MLAYPKVLSFLYFSYDWTGNKHDDFKLMIEIHRNLMIACGTKATAELLSEKVPVYV